MVRSHDRAREMGVKTGRRRKEIFLEEDLQVRTRGGWYTDAVAKVVG